VDAYSGFEPQVGEIRALRTFRVGPGGLLYPLFSDHAWTDATNTASCPLPHLPGLTGLTGQSHLTAEQDAPHAVPDPDCTCGFYAYADETGALDYPNARHVLAVISCWGGVIAGTRGIRAQHARIDAIWMSRMVPPELSAMVAARYGRTEVFADKREMLSAYPPTVLDCYEPRPAGRTPNRIALRVAVLTALVVGILPASWLTGNLNVRVLWAGELAFFVGATIVLHRRRGDAAAKRGSLIFSAVALWLVAPYAGAAGTLFLRLPLLQIATLTTFQRHLMIREASHFPARIGSDRR
jgi:hypothetical protein